MMFEEHAENEEEAEEAEGEADPKFLIQIK